MDIIEEFERQAISAIEELNSSNEEEDSMEDSEEDENDEEATFDDYVQEELKMASTTIITDKYSEDPSKPTVVNAFAKMVTKLDQQQAFEEEDVLVTDPEDNFYQEDEQDIIENEIDQDLFTNLPSIDDLDDVDIVLMEKLIQMKRSFLAKQSLNSCKCSMLKTLSFYIQYIQSLQKMKAFNETLEMILENFKLEIEETIQQLREAIKLKPMCSHDDNEISSFVKNVLIKKRNDPEKIRDLVKQQNKKIKENLQKLFIAPGEKGEWMNWESDVYLEEKLFPALFPYGIGGYLSSNVLKNSNMGFANYVKSRLLSSNPKFRNDPFYVFFLLLVKEMVEMIRSEKTYFRKAAKVPKLTPSVLQEIPKEMLQRYNTIFSTFKTIRGTSMYFQDVKKRLLATIRQKGSPTLFCTFSSAEFQWDELIQSIYETVTKTKVSLDFIRKQDSSWKNKLVSENVVQSTMHFAKRTEKLMTLLKKKSPFFHNGIQYHVVSFFYRVEFQVSFKI